MPIAHRPIIASITKGCFATEQLRYNAGTCIRTRAVVDRGRDFLFFQGLHVVDTKSQATKFRNFISNAG